VDRSQLWLIPSEDVPRKFRPSGLRRGHCFAHGVEREVDTELVAGHENGNPCSEPRDVPRARTSHDPEQGRRSPSLPALSAPVR
jgi:hypothetical protein